jgi:hypothetical protein
VADLERVVRGIQRREIEKLGKTERMNLLVSPRQKEEIRAAAARYGLTMTTYLLTLHALIEGRGRSRKSGRR